MIGSRKNQYIEDQKRNSVCYSPSGNNITTYGMTHALRIPLATPTSGPQLKALYDWYYWIRQLRVYTQQLFAPSDMQYLHLDSLSLRISKAKKRGFNI